MSNIFFMIRCKNVSCLRHSDYTMSSFHRIKIPALPAGRRCYKMVPEPTALVLHFDCVFLKLEIINFFQLSSPQNQLEAEQD